MKALIAIFALSFWAGANADPSADNITIQASVVSRGANVIYRYKIINNSDLAIHMVTLGADSTGQQLPSKSWINSATVETVPQQVSGDRCKPLTYMMCQVVVFKFEGMTEQRAIFTMSNSDLGLPSPPSNYSHANWIMPGTSSSVAELTVPSKFASSDYLHASGEVFFIGSYPTNTSSPITSLIVPFTPMNIAVSKLPSNLDSLDKR